MKLKSPMLVVSDIDKSFQFYKKALGLHVIMDFGANKTLTGGLALQTAETYRELTGINDISFGGGNFEIYFEENNFDDFIDRLKEYMKTVCRRFLESGMNPEQVAQRMDVPIKFVNGCMR